MGRQLSDALPKRQKGKGADGTDKLSVLSQRLLKGWRDKRQSVSEPPRSKRESELIASSISATREPKKPSSFVVIRVVDQRDPTIRLMLWLVFSSPCVSIFFFSRSCWSPSARVKVLFGVFRLLVAELWFVVSVGRGFCFKTLTDTSRISFLSKHYPCRDGGGKKVTGKKHGTSHDNGRMKGREKTSNLLKGPPGLPDPLIEKKEDSRVDACAARVPDRRDRECGEPLAP